MIFRNGRIFFLIERLIYFYDYFGKILLFIIGLSGNTSQKCQFFW